MTEMPCKKNQRAIIGLAPRYSDTIGVVKRVSTLVPDNTVNKHRGPHDHKSPFVTSGIRVGTAEVTTRLMKESDMDQIVEWIDQIILDSDNESLIDKIKGEVNTYMEQFPLYE